MTKTLKIGDKKVLRVRYLVNHPDKSVGVFWVVAGTPVIVKRLFGASCQIEFEVPKDSKYKGITWLVLQADLAVRPRKRKAS